MGVLPWGMSNDRVKSRWLVAAGAMLWAIAAVSGGVEFLNMLDGTGRIIVATGGLVLVLYGLGPGAWEGLGRAMLLTTKSRLLHDWTCPAFTDS